MDNYNTKTQNLLDINLINRIFLHNFLNRLNKSRIFGTKSKYNIFPKIDTLPFYHFDFNFSHPVYRLWNEQ